MTPDYLQHIFFPTSTNKHTPNTSSQYKQTPNTSSQYKQVRLFITNHLQKQREQETQQGKNNFTKIFWHQPHHQKERKLEEKIVIQVSQMDAEASRADDCYEIQPLRIMSCRSVIEQPHNPPPRQVFLLQPFTPGGRTWLTSTLTFAA